jgi:lipopolysaccharide export LptBFGC system permease protein LptF
MSRLDRYVWRIAVGAFAAALTFFMFLAVLVDLLNSIGEYVRRADAKGLGSLDLAGYLALYYLKLIPVLFILVTPYAVVIAGMFTVARLQHANEVVPMLFVGRSIHAVLRPVLALGLAAALAMGACWQWVVPQVGSALANAQAFLKEGIAVQKCLVHELHGAESQYFYALEFEPQTRTLRKVALLVQGVLDADVTLVVAEQARWDAGKSDWQLVGGLSKRADGHVPQQWLGRPDLTPDVLLRESRDSIDPELLSYSDLFDMAQLRPNRPDIRLALHHHITYPLACLLLLLLALPMAVHYERGSRIGRVLWAIGLCGAFVLVDMTCQSLGQRGTAEGPWVHPVMAAWLPTILFGSLGIVLYGGIKT